jgi:LPS export ABC transporter protein LptC
MMEGVGFRRSLTRGILLTFALVLSALLGVAMWRGGERREPQANAPAGNAFEADMKLMDMEYTEMERGQKLWTINASEAKFFEKEQKTLLSAVHLTFYSRDNNELHLESDEGILYAGAKDIELWGNVHATTPQGYTLVTERAFYNHAEKTVSSETPVHIAGPDLTLTGGQWRYLISEQRAFIEGHVEATLVIPPMEPPATQSGSAASANPVVRPTSAPSPGNKANRANQSH